MRVETAEEMLDTVSGLLPSADVSVFAAAVADFRPIDPKDEKVKREDTGGELKVSMTANPDIAGGTATLRKPGSVAVGFALETADVIENAARKLEKKAFDLMVANDATEEGAGFEGVTNRVTILSAEGEPEALRLMSKDEVAEEILDRVARRLGEGG